MKGKAAAGAALIALLLAAAGLRIVGFLRTGYLPDGDALGYLETARHLAEGRGLATSVLRGLPQPAAFPAPSPHYPLLPLLTGLLGRLGAELETAGAATVLAFLLLGLWALHRAGRELGLGPWRALVPVLLVGLHRHHTVATTEVLTDGPALGLGAAVLLLLLRARGTAPAVAFLGWCLAGGAAAVAAGLCRLQCLTLVALGPLWLPFAVAGWRRLAGPAAFLVPGILLGAWKPNQAASLAAEMAPAVAGVPEALAAAFNPGSPHSLFAGLGPLLWLALAGLAAATLCRRRLGTPWLLPSLAVGLGLLPLVLFRAEAGWGHPWLFADRPALQLLPPLALLAAAPLLTLPARRARGLALILLLGLAAVGARESWRYAWRRGRLTTPPELGQLLAFVRGQPELLARPVFSPETRFLAWHTGAHGFQGRDAYTLEQVLAALPASAVGWIVVASRWDGDLPWAREILALPAAELPAGWSLATELGTTDRVRVLSR